MKVEDVKAKANSLLQANGDQLDSHGEAIITAVVESINENHAPPPQRPIKPVLDEVIAFAAYQDHKPNLPASECERFYNYYESNGWRVGKNPMRNWKAALFNWRSTWLEHNPQQRSNHGIAV